MVAAAATTTEAATATAMLWLTVRTASCACCPARCQRALSSLDGRSAAARAAGRIASDADDRRFFRVIAARVVAHELVGRLPLNFGHSVLLRSEVEAFAKYNTAPAWAITVLETLFDDDDPAEKIAGYSAVDVRTWRCTLRAPRSLFSYSNFYRDRQARRLRTFAQLVEIELGRAFRAHCYHFEHQCVDRWLLTRSQDIRRDVFRAILSLQQQAERCDGSLPVLGQCAPDACGHLVVWRSRAGPMTSIKKFSIASLISSAPTVRMCRW